MLITQQVKKELKIELKCFKWFISNFLIFLISRLFGRYGFSIWIFKSSCSSKFEKCKVLALVYILYVDLDHIYRNRFLIRKKRSFILLLFINFFFFFLFLKQLYVNFVIGGVTRVTMIIGVVHNIAEVFNGFSIFATIAPNLFRKSKIQPFFLSIPLIIYVLVELLAVIFAPLEEGYLWLVVMGFIADVWNWVWLGIGRYKRTLTTYPFISCSFHMLYTVFIAFNCGFAPWGRFLGLLWNTFAVVIFCIGTRFWPYELFYGENVRGVDGDDRNETNQKSASSNDNNIALTEKSSTTTTTTTAPSTESDQKSV